MVVAVGNDYLTQRRSFRSKDQMPQSDKALFRTFEAMSIDQLLAYLKRQREIDEECLNPGRPIRIMGTKAQFHEMATEILKLLLP